MSNRTFPDSSLPAKFNSFERRIRTLETSPQTSTMTPRDVVTATGYLSTTSATPVALWRYEFPLTSPRLQITVEISVSAGDGTVDIYDAVAGAQLAMPYTLSAGSGTVVYYFTATNLTSHSDTGYAIVDVRASVTGANTVNVRPVWAGNIA